MTLLYHVRPQVFTPLVTPFVGGAIDNPELEKAIDRQIVGGVDGIIVGDVIGEGFSLSGAERETLLKVAIAHAGRHVGVIAVTGTNCTRTTIERSQRAENLGADALFVTIPYYSKPTRAGIVDHFRQIAAAVSIPVIIDDDPGRTAIDHGTALIQALSEFDIIVGLCHGSNRLAHFSALPSCVKSRFQQFSRDDRTATEFIRMGGHGLVSPVANVIPSPVQTVVSSAGAARPSALSDAVAAAVASLGQDDVAALKEAMAVIHAMPADVRLPLVPVEADIAALVRDGFAPFIQAEQTSKAAA